MGLRYLNSAKHTHLLNCWSLCWHFLFVTLFATLAVFQSIFPMEFWSELHGVICHCCLVCWTQQFHPRHYHHKSIRSEWLYLCCLTLLCLSLFVIIWCKWMFITDWNLQPGHPSNVKEDYFLVHCDFNTVCLWTFPHSALPVPCAWCQTCLNEEDSLVLFNPDIDVLFRELFGLGRFLGFSTFKLMSTCWTSVV